MCAMVSAEDRVYLKVLYKQLKFRRSKRRAQDPAAAFWEVLTRDFNDSSVRANARKLTVTEVIRAFFYDDY